MEMVTVAVATAAVVSSSTGMVYAMGHKLLVGADRVPSKLNRWVVGSTKSLRQLVPSTAMCWLSTPCAARAITGTVMAIVACVAVLATWSLFAGAQATTTVHATANAAWSQHWAGVCQCLRTRAQYTRISGHEDSGWYYCKEASG